MCIRDRDCILGTLRVPEKNEIRTPHVVCGFYLTDKEPVSYTHLKLYGKHAPHIMKTDVKEKDNTYEVAIDLPGFKKDEIQIQLENGYVTVSAAKGLDKDEKDKEGKYIQMCIRDRPCQGWGREFESRFPL